MVGLANRTPNLRRRFFLEKIEIVQSLMKRGDYLKDIHSEVFALGEMSYSQFARYVQKYIKGVSPSKRVSNIQANVTIPTSEIDEETKSNLEQNSRTFHKSFIENRDQIY